MTKVKREKKVRVKGEPVPAIKWFQDQAAHTKDPETITKAAEKHEYSPNTITIQLGRLRGMGLIPVVDKMVKEKKVRVLKPKMDKKTAKAKSFHPVPKPGQKEAV